MSDPVITITINENGDCTHEVDGVVGKECETLTAALVKAAGGAVSVRKKPEHARVSTVNRNRTVSR